MHPQSWQKHGLSHSLYITPSGSHEHDHLLHPVSKKIIGRHDHVDHRRWRKSLRQEDATSFLQADLHAPLPTTSLPEEWLAHERYIFAGTIEERDKRETEKQRTIDKTSKLVDVDTMRNVAKNLASSVGITFQPEDPDIAFGRFHLLNSTGLEHDLFHFMPHWLVMCGCLQGLASSLSSLLQAVAYMNNFGATPFIHSQKEACGRKTVKYTIDSRCQIQATAHAAAVMGAAMGPDVLAALHDNLHSAHTETPTKTVRHRGFSEMKTASQEYAETLFVLSWIPLSYVLVCLGMKVVREWRKRRLPVL